MDLVVGRLHDIRDDSDYILSLEKFQFDQHSFTANPPAAPEPEQVFTLLDERLLYLLQILCSVITNKTELRLQGVSVSVEHLISYFLILRFPSKEVDEIDDYSNYHDDFHVEVFPVGPQVSGYVDDLDGLLGRRHGCPLLLGLGLVVKLIRILVILIAVEPFELFVIIEVTEFIIHIHVFFYHSILNVSDRLLKVIFLLLYDNFVALISFILEIEFSKVVFFYVRKLIGLCSL